MTAWIPQECTLPTAQRPLRVAEFDELFARATRPPRRRTPDRLEIVLAVGAAGRARDLAARETECCSFFAFDVREVADGVVLEVGVPPSQVAVLDAVQARVDAARAGVDGQT